MFFLRSLTCLMSVFEILVEADTAFRCLARLGLDRWPSLCYPKTGLFIPVKLRPCEWKIHSFNRYLWLTVAGTSQCSFDLRGHGHAPFEGWDAVQFLPWPLEPCLEGKAHWETSALNRMATARAPSGLHTVVMEALSGRHQRLCGATVTAQTRARQHCCSLCCATLDRLGQLMQPLCA